MHGAGSGSGSPSTAVKEEKKDLYDGAFTHNIDINDLRNRYLITKGSTQQEVSGRPLLWLLGSACLITSLYGFDVPCVYVLVVSDRHRDRSIDHHQRRVAPGPFQSRPQRRTSLPTHCRSLPNSLGQRHQTGQRAHRCRPRPVGRGQEPVCEEQGEVL
jgi:hypothetical protein